MNTVIFIDLDDTILRNPIGTGVFPFIFDRFRQYNPDLDDARLWKEIEGIYRPRYADKRIDSFDWDDMIGILAKKYNVPEIFSISELIEKYAYSPHIRVFDHVKDALTSLKEDTHRKLAISTNGNWSYQKPTVQALGLLEYFDYILTPDRCGCLKGKMEFYQPALNGSTLQIAIGDQYDADVEDPRLLGFQSIWIPIQFPPSVRPEASPLERANQLIIPQPYTQRPNAIIRGFDEVYATIIEMEKSFFE